jgi:hypothetical protein
MGDTLNCIVLTILAICAGLAILIPAFAFAIRAGRNKKLRNKTEDLQ